MTRGFSTYLDVLRFGAAVVVLMSHYGYERMSDGRWLWIRELNLGSDAVIVFFVLSGFVIAHVAARPEAAMGRFAFDRLPRLVSVALPALLLGFALDRFGTAVAPEAYASWFYTPLSLGEMLARGLSFTNEWAGMETRLGTNGPFWSLSYEAAYYALFAVAFFMSGFRRAVLLALGAWLVGLNILVLLPVWLMGVGLHHIMKRELSISRTLAMALAVLPVGIYAVSLAVGLPAQLYAVTADIDAAMVLRFSNEPLWNYYLGVLVSLHLLGVAGLLKSDQDLPMSLEIKWLAGASFSIYLIHYPLLQTLSVLPLGGLEGWSREAVVLGITFLSCFAFASLFERPLVMWRDVARGVMRPTSLLNRT